MTVSVCMASYNTLELTRRCLESLQAAGEGVSEVIVVDDGSTDGSQEYLKTLGAPFRVFLNSVNEGYARRNNFAARQATGEALCFLNSDTRVGQGWLQPMLQGLGSLEKAGLVGNIQKNPATGRYDHMGIYFTEGGEVKHFGKGWGWVPWRGYRPWPAVTAACCVIKRELFLGAGGFDEVFVNGYEDVDLCLKLSAAGYKNYVACESRIDHHVSASPGRNAARQANRELFEQRWGARLKELETPGNRRLDAINYLVGYLDRPWRYNARKLGQALRGLWGATPK